MTAPTLTRVAPLVLHVPPRVTSWAAGEEAVEYAETCGITLDEWERAAVIYALAEGIDGRWAAFEVAIIVARQNGKNYVIRAIQIACLFLFDDDLLIHSAHQFDTSEEHRRWLMELLESHDEFSLLLKPTDTRTGRSKSFSASHGNEQIELTTGQRIVFKTRSGGKGIGFTAGKVFIDEAQRLVAAAMGSLVPTMSTLPGAQLYYTGSAPGEASQVLHAVRNRALADDPDDELFYMEFGNTADGLDHPPQSDEYMEAIRRANPAIDAGHITEAYIRQEIRTFSGDPDLVEEHRRERMGVPTMPIKGGGAGFVDLNVWQNLSVRGVDGSMPADGSWEMVTHRKVGLAVAEDRRFAAIGRAGLRHDGDIHVESFWRAPGTGWVPTKAAELAAMAKDAGEVMTLLVGAGTAAASLMPALKEAGWVETKPGKDPPPLPKIAPGFVQEVSGVDQARGVGQFEDAVIAGRLWHLNTTDLNIAVEYAAVTVTDGGARRLSAKRSKKDISPLAAICLAVGAIPDTTTTVDDGDLYTIMA